jgi:muramoyltetrapeptide carboxypeptidase
MFYRASTLLGRMAEKRKGRPVRPGSLIAVSTPGSPLLDLRYLESGVSWLQAQGFRVRLTEHANAGTSFKAGPPELRASDLHDAFADPEVDAICPLAGGHSAPQILPLLDLDLIAANPKPFVGFSELTALHAALVGRAGLVTFYGPVVSALGVLPDWTRHGWLRAVTTTVPLGVVDAEGPPARTLVPGVAEGELVGGTLSLVDTLLGTPFEIDTRGKILLLEDINEEPPRVDRFLTHLRNAGKLKDCAGIWLGNFNRCVPRTLWPLWQGYNLTLEELIDELIVPLGIPAMHGLRVGHGHEMVTVPLGVRARLDAGAGQLEILEAALVE